MDYSINNIGLTGHTENMSIDDKISIYMTELAKNKDKSWFANYVVNHIKLDNFKCACESSKLEDYRAIDMLKFSPNELKQLKDMLGLFDKQGIEKRDSDNIPLKDYIKSDFKPCPLVVSLNNILVGNIKKYAKKISVTSVDKIAMDKQVLYKKKVLANSTAIELLNRTNHLLGKPQLDPYTNVKSLNKDRIEPTSDDMKIIDLAEGAIENDLEFQILLDAGGGKDSVCLAKELAIEHYTKKLNFKDFNSEKLIKDIKHVNATAYRLYTSAIDGSLKYEYLSIDKLYTSKFKNIHGEDIVHWKYTYQFTLKEFIDYVGGELTLEDLYTKLHENGYYTTEQNKYSSGTELIEVDYYEVKTINYDKQTKEYYETWKIAYVLSKLNGSGITSRTTASSTTLEDFEKSILYYGNLQDKFRYGDAKANAKPSLVVYRHTEQISFNDIIKSTLDRMNYLWVQSFNQLANFIPTGYSVSWDTLLQVAEMIIEDEAALDEDAEIVHQQKKVGKVQDIIDKFIYTGRLITTSFADETKTIKTPPVITETQSGALRQFYEIIGTITTLYNILKQSVGFNDTQLGVDPRPHQVLEGIQIATEASATALSTMYSAYEYLYISLAERICGYVDIIISNEFTMQTHNPKTQRAKELQAVIGTYGVNFLELFSDIREQQITLILENITDDQARAELLRDAKILEANQLVPYGTFHKLSTISNYKLGVLYLMVLKKIEENKRMRQAQMANEAAVQQQLAAQKAEIDKLRAEKALEVEAENAKQDHLANVKTNSQMIISDRRTDNRIAENKAKQEADDFNKTL